MGRPHRGRWIGHQPDRTFFKPAGVPVKQLKTTTIEFDELAAMRLVDGEELKQTEAAEHMGISQSTIARLLSSGRKKAALALAHGEALKLQQGDAPLNFKQTEVNEMPAGDKTGPEGKGAGSGRSLGQRAGNPMGRGVGSPRGGGGRRNGQGRNAGRGIKN